MSDAKARELWERYEYARDRGHRDYCARARRCEQFYLGGGLQWSPEDLATLAEAGRPAHEINLTAPAVNAAAGYQINNRMQISYRPRGRGADEQTATVLSKVAMQIADNNQLRWCETEAFSDGLIQQRGYLDIRMGFDDSLAGEIRIVTMDPLDVIPDPDAKGYDPDTWSDVLVTRWMTLDEIEQLFGKSARREIEAMNSEDDDWGEESLEEGRPKFGGNTGGAYDSRWAYGGIRRVRVIERQYWVLARQEVAIYPTGDIRVIDANEPPPDGAILTKRMTKRVKWCVATADVVLHEEWSPYPHFTIIPYFPYFRRGQTRGMVDAAMSPQELLNKSVSQYLHILNTTANSGWLTEENSLVNMDAEELEQRGAETGLVVEYARGSTPPTKIGANVIPQGIDRMIERATATIKETTGITESFMGMDNPDMSGIAIQSRQHAAQNLLAVPLDNLARTRHLLASRMLDLIQRFYREPRIIRITETDLYGRKQSTPLAINQQTPSGMYNDLTVGEYDVVISEQPLQITWENSQFQQGLELRKAGIPVPDEVLIRHSNLEDKEEIAKSMAERGKQIDPTMEAKAKLLTAQAEKTQAEMVNKAVEAQYSAIQTAQTIATLPATAGLADTLLKSAGYVDKDAPPIVPQLAGPVPGAVRPPRNNDPITPTNPARGIDAGMESPKS